MIKNNLKVWFVHVPGVSNTLRLSFLKINYFHYLIITMFVAVIDFSTIY